MLKHSKDEALSVARAVTVRQDIAGRLSSLCDPDLFFTFLV